jgi:hypothetical protein
MTRSTRTFIRLNQVIAFARNVQAASLSSSARISTYDRREASSMAT